MKTVRKLAKVSAPTATTAPPSRGMASTNNRRDVINDYTTRIYAISYGHWHNKTSSHVVSGITRTDIFNYRQ
jgi:hypothetical protein